MIGGEPAENAAIMRAILDGTDTGPRRNIVLLNAAAILGVETNDFAAGLTRARAAIESGAAIAKLEEWIEKTNEF
jgi:anthranilate phosphoribosyltransferase